MVRAVRVQALCFLRELGESRVETISEAGAALLTSLEELSSIDEAEAWTTILPLVTDILQARPDHLDRIYDKLFEMVSCVSHTRKKKLAADITALAAVDPCSVDA